MASTTLTNRSDKFVLVRTWKEHGEYDTWADGPFSRERALECFGVACACAPAAADGPALYGPHTGNRIRVMTQDEWKRVNGGDR